MAAQPMLSHADLDKAFAFIRDAEDEDGEIIAVDHPEFYCTKVHGVHRAALPRLSDRDFTSFHDAEDALIARIDGEPVTEDDEELLCQELSDDEVDEEYEEAWLAQIEQASQDFFAGVMPAADPVPVIVRRRGAAKTVIVDDEALPAVLSPRRALLAGPKTVIKETGPDRHCWKDNTTKPAQFLRHA